jgi:hypothetical protein
MPETKILIEVVPNPRFKGDWQVRCERLLPWPIWFKDRQPAISYAEWLGSGREVELRV